MKIRYDWAFVARELPNGRWKATAVHAYAGSGRSACGRRFAGSFVYGREGGIYPTRCGACERIAEID